MRRLLVVIALAGCGDPKVAKLESARAEVCACKTAACGDAAMKKVPQANVASNHRTQQLARDMLDCLHKLYMQDRPDLDPDAELDAGDGEGSASGSARP